MYLKLTAVYIANDSDLAYSTMCSWLPMPWSVAGWTTATPCLGASLPMSYANCSVYRTALLELSAKPLSTPMLPQ